MEKQALYQKIASAISHQIRTGVWKTGDKLPSLRNLSQEYGVSMNTATQSYFELERNGLILARPQSGYFVSHQPCKLPVPATSRPKVAHSPQKEEEDLIDKVFLSMNDPKVTRLSLGFPENELLPIAKLNKALIKAMRTLPGSGTGYEEVQGNAKLRRDIARQAYTWSGELHEDDIVTTAGTMNALAFGLMALTRSGDTIAVESPVYFGILQLARSLGLNVLELPTHPVTGIDPEALKKALPKIKLCLLISNFNNPLGSCMPDEHKKEVVKMLSEREIPLLEDDLYGDVYFGPGRPKPCKAFDEDGWVLWCGSVSKTLAPGYRVGWIAPGRFKEAILRQKLIHSVSSTTLMQEVVANFLENGRYEHHLRQLRRTLHHNSLQFIRCLSEHFPDGTKVSRPQGGFMLWLELDKRIDTAQLYEKAIRNQISIAPGRIFTLQSQFRHCMRLSYGQLWTPELEGKLRHLGKIAKSLYTG